MTAQKEQAEEEQQGSERYVADAKIKAAVEKEVEGITESIAPLVEYMKRQKDLEDSKAKGVRQVKIVPGHQDVSIFDRAERESQSRNLAHATVSSIQHQRTNTSLQHAMSAVLGQHQDYGSDVDTGIIDLASILENIVKYANKIGTTSWSAKLRPLLTVIILGIGLVVIGLAILQPQDLEIMRDALNNERNLFIFLGLVGLLFAAFIYDRYSKRRQANKARQQYGAA